MTVSLPTAVLAFCVLVLFIFNIYQFLIRRMALRIGEILFIMSRNVRAKAAEVREDQKDVEIVEAHLSDIVTSACNLVKVLAYGRTPPDSEAAFAASSSGKQLDGKKLIRLADNILYATLEEAPTVEWGQLVGKALDRFVKKVPALGRDGAWRIMESVAHGYEQKGLQLAGAHGLRTGHGDTSVA